MESTNLRRGSPEKRRWSLLSRHGMVIVLLALNRNLTIREISLQLDLTDRTVYSIIRDLAGADMVHVARVGRNNTYAVNGDARLVNPMFSHVALGRFLELLKPRGRRSRRSRRDESARLAPAKLP